MAESVALSKTLSLLTGGSKKSLSTPVTIPFDLNKLFSLNYEF